MRRNWLWRGLVSLVVLVIAVLVVVAFSLGAIVKQGVERVGPKATGVDVKLKGASVWLLGGRAQLSGFVLGNPSGCKTPNAMAADDISVRVKPGSVFSHKVMVESINLKSPVITFEGGLGKNNLKQIQDNLNAFTSRSSGATNAAVANAAPTNSAQSEKKMQVDDLLISGAQLQVNSAATGGKTVTLPVREIHLTGLGTGPDGITPAEVGQKAMQAILASAEGSVTQLGNGVPHEAAGAAKSEAEKLKGIFH